MKNFLFLFILLFVHQWASAQGTPTQESGATDNVVFKQYINPVAPQTNPANIFPIYQAGSNTTTDYQIAVNTAKNFNSSYNPISGNKLALLIFHGRFYVDVEQIKVPSKGWSTNTTSASEQSNRLNILKDKYNKAISTQYRTKRLDEFKKLYVQDMTRRLDSTIKATKPIDASRYIVFCAIEVYYLSYKSFENANTNGEKKVYTQFFWHANGLNPDEAAVYATLQREFSSTESQTNTNTQTSTFIGSLDYFGNMFQVGCSED